MTDGWADRQNNHRPDSLHTPFFVMAAQAAIHADVPRSTHNPTTSHPLRHAQAAL